jgi:hypothetical protein
MSDEAEREQEEHYASDVEMRSQVAWLEARGWSIGED